MIYRTFPDVRLYFDPRKIILQKKDLQHFVANLLSTYVLLLPPGIKEIYYTKV